ncbi:hypothetical protein [Sulfitobacter sp.]|jgi:hypothetical protein
MCSTFLTGLNFAGSLGVVLDQDVSVVLPNGLMQEIQALLDEVAYGAVGE